jgi:hypothetical protein
VSVPVRPPEPASLAWQIWSAMTRSTPAFHVPRVNGPVISPAAGHAAQGPADSSGFTPGAADTLDHRVIKRPARQRDPAPGARNRWLMAAAPPGAAAMVLVILSVLLAVDRGWPVPAPGSAYSPGESARTVCQNVVHIGDSTSAGLNSPRYLPDPALRLSRQYARIGVRTVHWEISGSQSIVETLPGQANGYAIARQLVRHGYHGCWVIALGTNDTADVSVGSRVSRSARIQRIMSVIGSQPVMWVNVKSLLPKGPYSESDMLQWDHALVAACASHPNLRIYDWASAARKRWFTDDGIHYTEAGYAARSRLIADALASAFPAGHDPSGACVVR